MYSASAEMLTQERLSSRQLVYLNGCGIPGVKFDEPRLATAQDEVDPNKPNQRKRRAQDIS
jgi:hypothetical protein